MFPCRGPTQSVCVTDVISEQTYWVYHLSLIHSEISLYNSKLHVELPYRWYIVVLLPQSLKAAFEFNDYRFLIIEIQGRKPCFERAQAPEQFSPRKSHRSDFKLRSKKVERFMLLFLPSDRKSIPRPGASPRRKLKSLSSWTVKMRSKIHTCQADCLFLIGCR